MCFFFHLLLLSYTTHIRTRVTCKLSHWSHIDQWKPRRAKLRSRHIWKIKTSKSLLWKINLTSCHCSCIKKRPSAKINGTSRSCKCKIILESKININTLCSANITRLTWLSANLTNPVVQFNSIQFFSSFHTGLYLNLLFSCFFISFLLFLLAFAKHSLIMLGLLHCSYYIAMQR